MLKGLARSSPKCRGTKLDCETHALSGALPHAILAKNMVGLRPFARSFDVAFADLSHVSTQTPHSQKGFRTAGTQTKLLYGILLPRPVKAPQLIRFMDRKELGLSY